MQPDETLLIELSRNVTGANVHQAKNLEYAYRGFCQLYTRGKTEQIRKESGQRASKLAREIRALISESLSLQ